MTKRANPMRAAIEARRERVARAYVRGATQAEIAAQEGVNQAQISRDLEAIRRAWRESAQKDLAVYRIEQLAKIDALERAYWQEWEESRREQSSTTQEKVKAGGDGEGVSRAKVTQRVEQRLGDPRYLAGVQWCIDKRAALLGLDAPKRIGVSGALDLALGFEGFSDDELDALDQEYR